MQKDNCVIISNDKDTSGMSEDFNDLSFDTALDNVRFYTTDIWKEDSTKSDALTPALCSICLKSELLQERLSTVTAADILASISLDAPKETLQRKERISSSSDEDFFSSEVFNLKQECFEILNQEKTQDLNENRSNVNGDARTVGFGRSEEPQGVSYVEPFDPRLTFAGLQDIVFPNYRFLKPDDEPQDNVCLAVDDVNEIVHEYLNKYSDYLRQLREPPGPWVGQPDAVLPAKFASYDLWAADRNEINVNKETDPDCRLLASKVSSHSVKRLWSDGSCYTASTSDDQDVFSRTGSVSEESDSPRESANACRDDLGEYDAFSYPFFQSETQAGRKDEPISSLWSGRNVDSFKDFVPRFSYGFNLPVPDVVHENKSSVNENTSGEDERRASKFFNIWCVPDPDDGQGDGVSSRCSERSESPPGTQTLSEKSSPEAGLQIPRLVSTKRRERPVRGLKNTRRSNVKDYQVTFVECAENTENPRCHAPEALSSSRAALSDTTVWTINGRDKDTLPADSTKRGFSKSETHQEYTRSRGEDSYPPATEKVELSAKSEPFFPRGTGSVFSGCVTPTGERLNTIDEELLPKDAKNCFMDTLEKRTSLSPTCKPFVPRTTPKDNQHHQQNEVRQQSLYPQLQGGNAVNSHEEHKPLRPYVAWSQETDASEDTPGKDYKLFGSGKSIFDDLTLSTDLTKGPTNSLGSREEQNKFTGAFSDDNWERLSNKETDIVSNLWDIWKNSSEPKLGLEDNSWDDFDATLLKPASSQQKCENLKELISTAPPTPFPSVRQNIWSDLPSQQEVNKCYTEMTHCIPSHHTLQPHRGLPTAEKPELLARMVLPPQPQQLELKPSLELLGHNSLTDTHFRQYRAANAPPWTGSERSVLASPYTQQDGHRFLQSQGVTQLRTSHRVPILPSQVTRLPPPRQHDATYRNMVVLHPHLKQPDHNSAMHTTLYPHSYAQPTLKPTTFQTLRQPLATSIQRVPLDQNSRLQQSIISRPNTAFAPPAGFAPAIPTQTYRHLTVAPKLVAVPAFDAHSQPRFFTSYLNFNNHNEDSASDCDVLEATLDPVGLREEEHDCERRLRARPIRANPANLIHIT